MFGEALVSLRKRQLMSTALKTKCQGCYKSCRDLNEIFLKSHLNVSKRDCLLGRDVRMEAVSQPCDVRKTRRALAGFEDGKRAISQAMRAVSRSWKRQGNRIPPEPPE